MPLFEVNIVCSDGDACCKFVKQHMEDFSKISNGKNHPYELVGQIFAKDFREIVRIVNELKTNVGGAIEDISINAIEQQKN